MEKNAYSRVYSRVCSDPAHNIICKQRFICGAVICPDKMDTSKFPECFIEKFNRYQPKESTIDRYKNECIEANKISWRDVIILK